MEREKQEAPVTEKKLLKIGFLENEKEEQLLPMREQFPTWGMVFFFVVMGLLGLLWLKA